MTEQGVRADAVERAWQKFYTLLALADGWTAEAAAAYAEDRVRNLAALNAAARWRGEG